MAPEVEDAPRELGLARARWPGEQDRVAGPHRDMLDPLDQAVEPSVAGLDPVLERRDRVVVLTLEARGELVVLAQVQVDDPPQPGPVLRAPRRRCLDQARGEVSRLGQQEVADLNHVGARRDVDEVVLAVRVKRVSPREVVELGEDLVEVPRVAHRHRVLDDFGLRRHRSDVLDHLLREGVGTPIVDQLEPIDDEVLVLAERHRGAPALPAFRALARVEGGAEQSDDDDGLWIRSGHVRVFRIEHDKSISVWIK